MIQPEPTKGAMAASPPEFGAFARQRGTRSRRTGNTNAVGDVSIDWTVLDWTVRESSTVQSPTLQGYQHGADQNDLDTDECRVAFR